MRKYNLSDEQQAHLVEELRQVGNRILTITFESPDTDAQTIRHHAYLRGKFDTLKDIIDDDYPAPDLTNPEN
jgi:hypothetical protein